jgi:hypothetical protein
MLKSSYTSEKLFQMMLKALVLSPEDPSGLEKLVAKGRDWRMRHRVQTLLYFADGWCTKEIAVE